MDEMKTPTLDRVNALREKLDICGEFLDFILEKFDVFNPELKREEPFYIGSCLASKFAYFFTIGTWI